MTEPPPIDDSPLDVRLLVHTHWDREWYLPAGRFRQRLVALVDELLDSRAEDEATPFLLDGQAAVLDDYLAVRPERRAELAAALASGALEAGPWYVLPDSLIPSGEALVRNLLAGRATLAAFGVPAPALLYCPDAFGHPAALPMIAEGFGAPVVLVWRGYGGARWPAGDAAWWRAASGARVLLLHLPPDGYETGSNLPADEAAARARWATLRATLAPRARLGLALVMNGADHHALQKRAPRAFAELARAAAPERVTRTTLGALAADCVARAAARELPEITGELRDSYGYTWTLQGTFATRAHQKRRNAIVERVLTRETEPFVALARALAKALAGASTQPSSDGRSALVRAAWRTLLLCHPHDTLCGCASDEVARAADARWDDALAQACGARDDALRDVVGHDAVAARERGRLTWRRALVVRNAAARRRGGVAEVELLTFVRDVPVGPGSGSAAFEPAPGVRGAPARVDCGGVLVQVLARAIEHHRVESPRHYPDDDLVEVARAVAWLPEIAGYGTRSFVLDERALGDAPALASGTLPPDVVAVTTVPHGIANGLLRVSAEPSGDVRLMGMGHDIASLIAFEDVGDAGDLYTHSPVGAVIRARFAGARVTQRGPLRGEIAARYKLRVPVGLAAEDAGVARVRPSRERRMVESTITVRLTLDAGAPFVRIAMEGRNAARDHRLRLRVATGVAGERVIADAAMQPVGREPIVVRTQDRAAESAPPTAPLHRYVTLLGADRAATLISDGLAEYEAGDDGTIAVTLVRAVGELSRTTLPERPGHAGWPTAVPEAQSLGPFHAEFALAPHTHLDDARADRVERLADDVLLPLRGETLRSALAVPAPTSGVTLDGDGLAFRALKPAEDGVGLVLRCVNLTGDPTRGAWTLGVPVARAALARLDETELGALTVGAGDRIEFECEPYATITIRVFTR